METLSRGSYSDAFTGALSVDGMRGTAPAIFADAPDERTSSSYTFISTERVLDGLTHAGFVPVDVRQARTRKASVLHARHLVRLRRRVETIQLKDSLPELLFLNAHDGSTAYQLRIGLYRVLCTNGLIVSVGAFPAFRVPHRGDVVSDVIAAALEMCERFGSVAEQVERMERTFLDDRQRLQFAERALLLRYDDAVQSGMRPSQLLTVRREADVGDDLWRTYNVIQENLLRGGLTRRSASGRLMRSRRITAIREDVRLNGGLWDLATQALAA